MKAETQQLQFHRCFPGTEADTLFSVKIELGCEGLAVATVRRQAPYLVAFCDLMLDWCGVTRNSLSLDTHTAPKGKFLGGF